ncbi:MAG: MarR family winged helix-turn-helix transcriptional regulator [Minwuia sp.]|uniref:MarR family winged helix-turn-helix transcriptional regulator n=1 Tax=Minwuia sp. TaxID=2493630 RepID=UPI003A849697
MPADSDRAVQNRLEWGADDTLNFQIVLLSNRLSLTVARRALADDGLTLREWRILAVVYLFGPGIARKISETALLDPAHVSRTVHAMRRRGLVEFRENKDDRRQIIVALTDEGDRVARDVLPKVIGVNNAFRGIYTEEEFETLIELLARANGFAEKLLESDELPVAESAPDPHPLAT